MAFLFLFSEKIVSAKQITNRGANNAIEMNCRSGVLNCCFVCLSCLQVLTGKKQES